MANVRSLPKPPRGLGRLTFLSHNQSKTARGAMLELPLAPSHNSVSKLSERSRSDRHVGLKSAWTRSRFKPNKWAGNGLRVH